MAIKVLAPAYYASQDIRTPVKIAVVVLVITQLLNVAFVPWLAHTGLALSIGLAALVNAAWLLVVLLRRGTYVPRPGWGILLLQVLAGSLLLSALLSWSAQSLDWIALQQHQWQRMGWLALIMGAAAVLYFGALWAAGLKLRQLLHR
ncbi:putative peptidoglycan biosynthesis protein MurJ [compost metagenome]